MSWAGSTGYYIASDGTTTYIVIDPEATRYQHGAVYVELNELRTESLRNLLNYTHEQKEAGWKSAQPAAAKSKKARGFSSTTSLHRTARSPRRRSSTLIASMLTALVTMRRVR